MREFEGKVAVITGAASGIGRAMADRFAEAGMKVVLGDIEEEALDRAVTEMRQAEHDVTGVLADVSSEAGVQRLADETLAAYGGVHVLCNNAGVVVGGSIVGDSRPVPLGATAHRLAVDARRESLGRDPRRPHLHADHARAGRTGTHREHGVDGRTDRRSAARHLRGVEARRGAALGGALLPPP